MAPELQSSVQGRLERLSRPKIRSGLLSVADETALSSAGFVPVSEVIGAVVNTVSPSGFYSPGAPQWSPPPAGSSAAAYARVPLTYKSYTSSDGNVRVGVPSTIRALKSGYRTALARLIAEAKAADADGVVGITVTRNVGHANGTEQWSFLAVGTAVRSTGSTHTTQPFTTDFSGAQVASSLHGGWVPISLLIVPCMAIRWVEPNSRMQRGRFAPNAEVAAYTDVVNTCRHQARQDFAAAARATRADAAVMSDISLEFEIESPEPVCTASVTITGTALGQVQRPLKLAPPLLIMPLGQRRNQRPKAGRV